MICKWLEKGTKDFEQTYVRIVDSGFTPRDCLTGRSNFNRLLSTHFLHFNPFRSLTRSSIPFFRLHFKLISSLTSITYEIRIRDTTVLSSLSVPINTISMDRDGSLSAKSD